jgi:hypothetical protein
MSPTSLTSFPADFRFLNRWFRRIGWLACFLSLWGCQEYPPGPPCCEDRPDRYDPYPNRPQSGSPADLPRGETEIGLLLDAGLRMWYDVFDAVPRQVYIGYGPDAPSGIAHDLTDTRPWSLTYAGRAEPLFPTVTAWDHSGPTAHVRIRLDRDYRGNPLTLDLEIRHGYEGNSHVIVHAYQVHGLLDGEALALKVGGEVSRGRWLQDWSAGGNGYLRGSEGHETLWMPGNGYHEARVRFR